MKLKPNLFQLFITLTTISLLASCATSPEVSQSDCDRPQTAQSNNCRTNYYGGSHGGSGGYRYGTSGSSGETGSSSSSSTRVGRGGFGSFGLGGHAGG